MKESIAAVVAAALLAAIAAPVAAEDSVGLQDPATGHWYLSDSEGDVTEFYFGVPGDVPFLGDWDCDGVATPGLYRASDGFAYLRNSNTPGSADITFFLGNSGDVPLAGDFNGNGCDTVSVYRAREQRFYIANTLGSGGQAFVADFSFVFGNPLDKPVAGDWDGDGITEAGLYREATDLFYWRNSLTSGVADGESSFGDPNDRFVAGDWGIVDGRETPAVFRPALQRFFFRHTLTHGLAGAAMSFGGQHMLPVAGPIGDVINTAPAVGREVPGPPAGGGEVPGPPAVWREVPSAGEALVELLNKSRAAECGGLPPLTPSPELTAVAVSQSVDMVVNGFFSHTSPASGTPFDRLTHAGLPWRAAAENIAVGVSIPELHAAWMASPGHRANICSAEFGKIGIGVVDNGLGALSATELFTN